MIFNVAAFVFRAKQKSYLRDVTQTLCVEQSPGRGANLLQPRGRGVPEASQPAKCCMETS